MNNEFFVSCPVGPENLLKQELLDLGLNSEVIVKRGGVQFKGLFRDALSVIINSRIASRVYHKAFAFTFGVEKDLYDKALEKEWDQLIDPWQNLKISTLVDLEGKKKFPNTKFLSLKLKDAMADFFINKHKKRPNVELDNPDVSILLRIDKKENSRKFIAQVYIDLCGIPLSNRGYRFEGHTSPLRENLAAAILAYMNYDSSKGLIDPMCGTGTFLIEAIYKHFNIVPSLKRIESFLENEDKAWNFLKYKKFKSELPVNKIHQILKAIYMQNIKKLELIPSKQLFVGLDNDENSLKMTRKVLRKLKLFKACRIENSNSLKVNLSQYNVDTLIVNPPYGERMNQQDENQLHFEFAENLKHSFKNRTAFIFTKKDLHKNISLTAKRKIPLKNGNIECRLLEYQLY